MITESKTKYLNPKNCTVHQTIDFISKRWTLKIVMELQKDNYLPKRYSYIKKRLPDITPKILSARLKELEEEQIIIKKVDTKSIPIKCEYQLTKSGKNLITVIHAFKNWALTNKIKNGTQKKACNTTECEKCKM